MTSGQRSRGQSGAGRGGGVTSLCNSEVCLASSSFLADRFNDISVGDLKTSIDTPRQHIFTCDWKIIKWGRDIGWTRKKC